MADSNFPGGSIGGDPNGGLPQPVVPAYGDQTPLGAPVGYQPAPVQSVGGYAPSPAPYGQAQYGQAPYGMGAYPPGAGGYPPSVPPTPPRRNGLMIVFIALAAVLVLVVIGLIVFFVARPAASPAPTPIPTPTHSTVAVPPKPAPTTTHTAPQPAPPPPTSTNTQDIKTSTFCMEYELYQIEVTVAWPSAQSDIGSGDYSSAQSLTGNLVTMAGYVQQFAPTSVGPTADAAVASITKVDAALQAGTAPAQSDMDDFTQANTQLDTLSSPICGG